MAKRVAEAMKTKLTPEERRRVGKRSTENLAAYDLYLQARRLPNGRPDTLAKSVSLLKQAVEMDPRFTDAMAEVGYRLAWFANPKDTEEARGWAERALAIEPDLSKAHHTLALVYGQQGFFNKARVALMRALETDPNHSAGMNDLSVINVATGHLEEAVHWARLALERDPVREASYYHVMNCLFNIGRRDVTERWYGIYKQRYPASHRTGFVALALLIQQGEYARALEQSRELYKSKPNRKPSRFSAMWHCWRARPMPKCCISNSMEDSLDAPFIQFWMFSQSPRVRYAWFALQRGDRSTAQRLLKEAAEIALKRWNSGVDTAFLPVELATIHTLENQPVQAMEWLNRAYDRGLREEGTLKLDPLFSQLRADPSFQKLIERIAGEKRRIGQDSTEIKHLFDKTVPALPPITPTPAKAR